MHYVPIFSVLPLSHRNTCGSSGELEIAVEFRACVPTTISCSPKISLVFLLNYINYMERWEMFCIS